MDFSRTGFFGLVAVVLVSGCVNPRWSRLSELTLKSTGGAEAPAGSLASPLPGTTPTDPQPELPNTQQAALCFNMAEALERQGRETDALIYYEQARKLDPALHDKAARRLAVLYDRHDQQARGMVEFQHLLKKFPKDASLLNDVGYSYYNRGQWAEAESYLRKAVAFDKTCTRAWVNLGMALAQQGKTEEAYEAFVKAVSPAEAYSNLGFILAQHPERRSEAIAAYRRALELEPTLPVAQLALKRLESSGEVQRENSSS